MLQFSHRDEKITKLFAIIFWTLLGFHIIFGCIPQLSNYVIYWLSLYQIANIFDLVDIRYVEAFYQWLVS